MNFAPTSLPPAIFSDFDRQMATLIEGLAGRPAPELALAAALACRQRRIGHLCLSLPSFAGLMVREQDAQIACPALDEWRAALRQARPVVGTPGEFSPLILDPSDRLYLQRYWAYERQVATDLLARASAMEPVDEVRLQAALDELFPPAGFTPDDQRLAAETAARRRLCVITGGPGTGKTHTLGRLLRVLLATRGPAEPPLRIKLAAPTGKAAARIQEELRRSAAGLAASPITAALLAVEATTLHRLLGARPHYASFRHGSGNPLSADVVVVDEASMVDLALMAKLLAAVPATARLILLGDKDQLASVEAGAVLGDICGGLEPSSGWPASPPNPLTPCLVQLRRNYRFPSHSTIHRLGQAIRRGEANEVLSLLREPGDVTAQALPAPADLAAALRAKLLAVWPEKVPDEAPEALRVLACFRVLCAVREGSYGVAQMNDLAERLLIEAGRIQRHGVHYAGRPILITRNDHALRLFNGDVGVLLPAADGALRAFFPDPEGGVRSIPTSRLPPHETVFAMTVHKSQGSEFASVLLVLPSQDSPVLTRELLYTGLTRAREHAEIWFTEPILRQAIVRRVERHSGLRDALWKAA